MDRKVLMKLVYSVINFLKSEIEGSSCALSEESNESVEVAIQCLETAYGISPDSFHLSTSKTLYEIFSEAVKNDLDNDTFTFTSSPSDEDKAAAEVLKNEGNRLMREDKYIEALESYTKAIVKDNTNAVYYSNRAAAHSKLNNHEEAVEDCKKALRIEPQYSKAYGRMGLAYSAMNKPKEARECYRKALEVEPDNESYQGNLEVAEEKLRSSQAQQQESSGNSQTNASPFAALGGVNFGGLGGLGGLAGLAGGSGGVPDMQALFNNPAMMNMATQLMSDPSMQNMMTSLLRGGNSPAQSTPSSSESGASGGGSGMDALVNAGRRLAEQIQSQNPDLIDQMRNQMGNRSNGNGGSNDPNNPQAPPP